MLYGRQNNIINDSFSKCHPAVNFVFFIGAVILGVVIQHPAFLCAGIFCAAIYYLLLNGKKGIKFILYMLPFAFIIAAVNPLFNTRGEHVLFMLFGNPYTAEALLYGAATAAVLVIMMLWLGCYNAVMTSDKFTSLFGNIIPSLSLLLVMVFRMVPALVKKTKQITAGRKAIGKGAAENASIKNKLHDGVSVLSALTSWALEGSIITADSMRSRGYGCAKRQSFMLYRMTGRDWLLLCVQLVLLALTVCAVAMGQTDTRFIPGISVAPVSWGLAVYTAYLSIPTVLDIEEVLKWRISRSKI